MNATDNDKQSEIEALLPWHAAGTLSTRDKARVEDALARDPELARRYALVRDELGETVVLNESLGAPSPQALEKLFTKIDAEQVRKPVRAAGLGLGARLSSFIASLTPRTLAYAASVAILAIVVQAGIIATVVMKEQGGYVTASAPSASPGTGAFALMRFAPQATQDDVTKFLEASKLSIVAGPSPGGIYKVRLSDAALPKAELAARIETLKDNKIVGFIAPTE